jgi:hypothetical protein
MFVVVNIPQSNLTPHLVGKLKRAYIRTGQSSKPEVIVHPDKLPWLLDHRKKSQSLRHILSDKAEAHFNNYLRSKFKQPDTAPGVISCALIPMYPQNPVTDYRNLPAILEDVQMKCRGFTFPPAGGFKTVQDGIVAPVSEVSTVELNSYGLMLYKAVLADERKYLDPKKFYQDILPFFKTASNFYNRIGFISPLTLRLKLSNARGAKIQTENGDKEMIEDYVRIDRTVIPMDIQSNLTAFVSELLEDFAWSIDLPFKDKQAAERLVEEMLNDCGQREL